MAVWPAFIEVSPWLHWLSSRALSFSCLFTVEQGLGCGHGYRHMTVCNCKKLPSGVIHTFGTHEKVQTTAQSAVCIHLLYYLHSSLCFSHFCSVNFSNFNCFYRN